MGRVSAGLSMGRVSAWGGSQHGLGLSMGRVSAWAGSQYGRGSSHTWAALLPMPARIEPVHTPMARLTAQVATLAASSASKVYGSSAATVVASPMIQLKKRYGRGDQSRSTWSKP